jgi:hydroxyethylthiazole kinase-like sugar kinase family protein
MPMGRTLLLAAVMLAASVWVGSLVCLAIVSSASRTVLDRAARVALFRRVGRLYGVVGTGCLLFAIIAGVVIFWPLSDAPAGGLAVLAMSLALVLLTAAGMAQARRMSASRQRQLESPLDQDAERRVQRGARLAGMLRGSIAVITLAIVVLGAQLINR